MAKKTTRAARPTRRAQSAAPAVQTRDKAVGVNWHRPGFRTMDGLQNMMTGLGGDKDKLFNTQFGFFEIPKEQLDAAYRGDWIARKGTDIPAFDTFREWRTWQADPDDVNEIEDTEKKYGTQVKAMKAMILGRLYGGGALILGVDQGNPEDPLEYESVGEGDLKFLHVVSRYDLSAGEIEWDITSPWYGQPKYFQPANKVGIASNDLKLHPSRVITFTGNDIPDINQRVNGWGDSVLQSTSDAVMGAGLTMASVAQMVSEAKLDVVKIPGLSENITTQEYEDRLRKRFEFANVAKSVFGILLFDKEEEWQRIESQFAGLPDVLKMYLLVASGAFDIPATRFLSQSPVGLSATGESDTRNYYDRISTEQKITVSPKLDLLDRVLVRSSIGDVPDDEYREMFYEWDALWTLSEQDRSTIMAQKATAFKTDVDAGLMNEVVLKKAREAQLIADGTYPGLQQIIDEYDDDPDLEQQKANEAALQTQLLGADPNDPNAPQPGDPKQVTNVPPQLPPPKAQSASSTPASNAKAVDGIVARLRDASTPRSLYVRRDVLNQDDIVRWARKQGFASVVPDMHVTIMYSKQPVDWLKIGADNYSSDPDGGLTVKPGGPRVIEKFGRAVVLAFSNSDLQYRHQSMMYRGEDDGISWDHEDYTPHITITWSGGGELDLASIEPYTGEIQLGPEVFEEIRGFDPDELDEQMLNDDGLLVQLMADINTAKHPETGRFEWTTGGGVTMNIGPDGPTHEQSLHAAAHFYGENSDKYRRIKRKLTQKVDSQSLQLAVIDAVKSMPAPRVDVHIQAPARRRVRRVSTVTKRDDRGRPEEMTAEEQEIDE